MVTSIVLHRVADYDAWRAVYDSPEVKEVQRAGGVTADAVFQSADDPSLVVVQHDFDTLETARAFFENEELRAALEQAGVDVDSLQLHFVERR